MDELKEKARPKHNELIGELKELNDKQEATIIMLDRLCTLKETQQDSDNTFRDDWANTKKRDAKITRILLAIAVTALTIDLIQMEENSIIGKLAGVCVSVVGGF